MSCNWDQIWKWVNLWAYWSPDLSQKPFTLDRKMLAYFEELKQWHFSLNWKSNQHLFDKWLTYDGDQKFKAASIKLYLLIKLSNVKIFLTNKTCHQNDYLYVAENNCITWNDQRRKRLKRHKRRRRQRRKKLEFDARSTDSFKKTLNSNLSFTIFIFGFNITTASTNTIRQELCYLKSCLQGLFLQVIACC